MCQTPGTTAALSAVDDALGLDGALAMLRQLPPAQAEVIVLRTISGFSAEEVGELTGQTPGAVGSWPTAGWPHSVSSSSQSWASCINPSTRG